MDDESIARLPVVDRQASSPPGPAGSFKKIAGSDCSPGGLFSHSSRSDASNANATAAS